jgi:hypothetical protein
MFLALLLVTVLGKLKDDGIKIKFVKTVECYKNFSEGECNDLTPEASACVWEPHASHGYCSYKEGNAYKNDFVRN